jgi:hypothetical protein
VREKSIDPPTPEGAEGPSGPVKLGKIIKTLVFSPGEVRDLTDEEYAAVKDDIGVALLDVKAKPPKLGPAVEAEPVEPAETPPETEPRHAPHTGGRHKR